MPMTITYEYKDSLYINITNRCSNKCSFCVRTKSPGVSDGLNLWLDHEPDIEEIMADIQRRDISAFREFIFCGYGEPMMRIDDIIEISKRIKKLYALPVRVNTNGQANLIHGKNIVPSLKGWVDAVSISLNSSNAKNYQEICQSVFGEAAYNAVLEFAILCKNSIPKVSFSIVDSLSPKETEECRQIAERIGVNFKIRHLIN